MSEALTGAECKPMDKGFAFVSTANNLHHILTPTSARVKDLEEISKSAGKSWTRRDAALF